MIFFRFGRRAVGFGVAVAMLAGCGWAKSMSMVPSVGSDANLRQAGSAATLLYVSAVPADEGKGRLKHNLSVLNYDTGSVVQRLNVPGFVGCSDKKGDVFVLPNKLTERQLIYEYAHGGQAPIAKLELPEVGLVVGCSIDPTSGNLAVSTNCTINYSGCVKPGYIAVYDQAKGSPKIYRDGTHPTLIWYCTYDNEGNLYIDFVGSARFAVLPQGGSRLKTITPNAKQCGSSGNCGWSGIQWDGQYLAAWVPGESSGQYYAIQRFRISGLRAFVVDSVKFHDIPVGITGLQFSIRGNTVVLPLGIQFETKETVSYYAYPAGGTPKKVIKFDSQVIPTNVAISAP